MTATIRRDPSGALRYEVLVEESATYHAQMIVMTVLEPASAWREMVDLLVRMRDRATELRVERCEPLRVH